MAKTFKYVAKAIRDAYISKKGAKVVSEITEKSGSFAERARAIGLTSQGIGSASGLRQGRLADWIIPGTMGITFASMSTATDAALNTSETIADYISPDFEDPTSEGAIFWTKTSADITHAADFCANTATKTADWTRDKITYATDFWKRKMEEGIKTYVEKRNLGKRYSEVEAPNNSIFGIIFNEIKYQIEGALIDYEVDPDSEWLKHVNQDSNIVSWNGIGNVESEGVPPTYEMRQKAYVTPAPIYEKDNVGIDTAMWAVDEIMGIDILTNEMREKTIAYLDKIDDTIKSKGISALVYSGSWNPKLKNLQYAAPENQNITALVGVGGVSFRGSWFPQKIDNPNLKLVINIWGDKDVFYKAPLGILKLVGPKRFEGVPHYNVMIKGADHGDYLNNNNSADERKVKIEYFVRKISEKAIRGDEVVYNFLTKPGITYDKTEKIYVVDPDNLKWEHIR